MLKHTNSNTGANNGADGAAGGRDIMAGEFNLQDIPNTLWAICCFFLQFNLSLRFCCTLCFSWPSMNFEDPKSLCQLHHFFMSCDMIEGMHADLSVSLQTLKEEIGPSRQPVFLFFAYTVKRNDMTLH